MKSTYRSIFNVITVFCVVFMILVSSLVVPVKATISCIDAYEYFVPGRTVNNDGVLQYWFNFSPITAWVQIANVDSSATYVQGYEPIELTIDPNVSATNIYYWPLGTANWSNADATSGLLSLQDFEQFVDFDLDSFLFVLPSYNGNGNADETVTYSVSSVFYLFFYDRNGKFISSQSKAYDKKQFSYTGSVDTNLPSSSSQLTCEIPSGCCYVCPMVKYSVYNSVGDSGWIYRVGSNLSQFSMSCSVDSVIQNSQTLSHIQQALGDLGNKVDQTNQQLGDLNEKSDTLINGTPELQDQADSLMNDSQNLDEELDAAIDQLKDLEDLSDDVFQIHENGFDGVISNINDFIVKRPWAEMTALVAPIMEFPPVVTILTMLIAFINVAILFFGR